MWRDRRLILLELSSRQIIRDESITGERRDVCRIGKENLKDVNESFQHLQNSCEQVFINYSDCADNTVT